MTYRGIDDLTNDPLFAGRIRACTVEQANTYKNDAHPDFVAVAVAALRGDAAVYLTFTRIVSAGPGMAETAGSAGASDQTRILDADILAAVQANWETVASLHYSDDGVPL